MDELKMVRNCARKISTGAYKKQRLCARTNSREARKNRVNVQA
jgi:hypothetical protein